MDHYGDNNGDAEEADDKLLLRTSLNLFCQSPLTSQYISGIIYSENWVRVGKLEKY